MPVNRERAERIKRDSGHVHIPLSTALVSQLRASFARLLASAWPDGDVADPLVKVHIKARNHLDLGSVAAVDANAWALQARSLGGVRLHKVVLAHPALLASDFVALLEGARRARAACSIRRRWLMSDGAGHHEPWWRRLGR